MRSGDAGLSSGFWGHSHPGGSLFSFTQAVGMLLGVLSGRREGELWILSVAGTR